MILASTLNTILWKKQRKTWPTIDDGGWLDVR